MYYASFNYIFSDVARFQTRQERDNWVNDSSSFLERVPVLAKDVRIMCGRNPIIESDNGIDYLINTVVQQA